MFALTSRSSQNRLYTSLCRSGSCRQQGVDFHLMSFSSEGQNGSLVSLLRGYLAKIYGSALGNGWTRNNELKLCVRRLRSTKAALSVVEFGQHNCGIHGATAWRRDPWMKCPCRLRLFKSLFMSWWFYSLSQWGLEIPFFSLSSCDWHN